MARDYVKILNDMFNMYNRGEDYVIGILVDYNVKYIYGIEKGIISSIYENIVECDKKEIEEERQPIEDRLMELIDKLMCLKSLQVVKDINSLVYSNTDIEGLIANRAKRGTRVYEEYEVVLKYIINSRFIDKYNSAREISKNPSSFLFDGFSHHLSSVTPIKMG